MSGPFYQSTVPRHVWPDCAGARQRMVADQLYCTTFNLLLKPYADRGGKINEEANVRTCDGDVAGPGRCGLCGSAAGASSAAFEIQADEFRLQRRRPDSHEHFMRGPQRRLTGAQLEQSALRRDELRLSDARYRRSSSEGDHGRHPLDPVEYSRKREFGDGEREAGLLARGNCSGQKRPRREWLSAALPAS